MHKKFRLAAASVAILAIAIAGGLMLYASRLDLPDPSLRYENRLKMWRLEPDIGFVNKSNFSTFGFGNVSVQTNKLGFRGVRHTSSTRIAGINRIIGLGDSVMWGTSVNESDSFLGILEAKLREDGLYEVINAGVVGYSTYQELLFFEKYILPLAPDVVLVNYCDNDVLPTEDPFNNARRIYIRYLKYLIESRDEILSYEEKVGVEKLIDMLKSAEHVWYTWHKLSTNSPELYRLAIKIFIELPIMRMVQLSREANVRLIYVFIPLAYQSATFSGVVERLKKLLIKEGAEFVDVQSVLTSADPNLTTLYERVLKLIVRLNIREIKQAARLMQIKLHHHKYMFIDSVHPSKRGNAIIADELYRYLQKSPAP